MSMQSNGKGDEREPTANALANGQSDTGKGSVASTEAACDAAPSAGPIEEEPGPALSESAQRLIGVQLRQLYRNIVDQPVPEELLRLLDELERREQQT